MTNILCLASNSLQMLSKGAASSPTHKFSKSGKCQCGCSCSHRLSKFWQSRGQW